MQLPFRVVVSGRSMLPTLSPGDRLLAVGVARVRRGDVYVVRHHGQLLVKRLVALPGGRVLVSDGKPRIAAPAGAVARAGPQPDGSWVLGPDEYLVQGDNSEESTDLRAFGPIGLEAFVGRVVFRYRPRPGRVRRLSDGGTLPER